MLQRGIRIGLRPAGINLADEWGIAGAVNVRFTLDTISEIAQTGRVQGAYVGEQFKLTTRLAGRCPESFPR